MRLGIFLNFFMPSVLFQVAFFLKQSRFLFEHKRSCEFLKVVILWLCNKKMSQGNKMKKVYLKICRVLIVLLLVVAGVVGVGVFYKYQQSEEMHIFMICNEEYAPFTAASIYSIEKNKDFLSKIKYHIAIVDDIKRTKEYFNAFDQNKIEFIDVPKFFKDKYDKQLVNAYNTRLLVAEIFPSMDKILYLDSDILVFKDLSKLYHTDLNDNYAGVVGDVKEAVALRTPVLGTKAYFNAGVILFNLKQMRQEGVTQKLIQTYQSLDAEKKLIWPDQDVLNVVFENKALFLPQTYNSQWSMVEENKEFHILHYTGYKPWLETKLPYVFKYWETLYSVSKENYQKTVDKSVFPALYKHNITRLKKVFD